MIINNFVSLSNFLRSKNRNQDVKELLSGGGITFGYKVIELLVRYLYILVISRVFGIDILGQYNISLSFVIFLVSLSLFGLDTAMVKLAGKYYSEKEWSKLRSLYWKIILIIIIIGSSTSLLIYFGAPYIAISILKKSYFIDLIRSFAFIPLPYLISQLNGQFLRGIKSFGKYSLVTNALLPLSNLLLLIIASSFINNTYHINILFGIGVLLTFIISSYILLTIKIENFDHFLLNKRIQLQIFTFNKIWEIALPMFLSIILFQILAWADIFFLGRYTSDADVAIFNIGMRIANLATVPLFAINSVMASQFIHSYEKKDLKRLAQQARQSTLLSNITTIPVIIGLVFMAPILLLMFGKDFSSGLTIIWIILIGQLINAITGSVSVLLQMTDKQKNYRNVILVVVIIKLIINIILIPTFGIVGAALSFTFTLAFQNLLLLFTIKKIYGFYVISPKLIYQIINTSLSKINFNIIKTYVPKKHPPKIE